MAQRKIFSDYEKKTIYAKCDGKCAICGKPVKFKHMTVDHKVPLSKGGTNEPSNLQLSCLECNRMKADFLTEEFMERIAKIRRHYFWNKLKKEIMIWTD